LDSIWYKKGLVIEDLEGLGRGTMGEHLGLVFTELGKDCLKAQMPVDHRTRQPYGLLHGGASCVLAETLGSVASSLVINPDKFICVGIEINANHLRSVKEGFVTGACMPLHIGASTHVWDIRIHDEKHRLICVSRLTVAVLKGTGEMKG
jgi:1,4-dihydroxy-2-naphthoyl-CoA hydrolase